MAFYRRFIYRRLQIFAHRFGWHRMRAVGPLLPGRGQHLKCDWCGLWAPVKLHRPTADLIYPCDKDIRIHKPGPVKFTFSGWKELECRTLPL